MVDSLGSVKLIGLRPKGVHILVSVLKTGCLPLLSFLVVYILWVGVLRGLSTKDGKGAREQRRFGVKRGLLVDRPRPSLFPRTQTEGRRVLISLLVFGRS